VLALNANNIRARELSMRVEQKKAETIAHLLSSAQSALSSKDHITALALCSQLLFIDSSNSAASEIKSKADDLKNADDLIKQKQQEAEGKGKKK